MKCKTLLTLGAIALLATGCQPAEQTRNSNATAASDKPEVAWTIGDTQQLALAARDALFKKLSTRLLEAMSNGGPAAAIEVCSREAPRIAAAVGEEHGVKIGRTSFKLRNPRNSPPEWAQPLIAKRSEEPKFVELPGGETGALLPIKLKTQCLTCHGSAEQIADDVKAKLTKLYPDDQATGFKDGDLRGWFWVVVANKDTQSAAGVTEQAGDWRALPSRATAPEDNPTTDLKVELGKKLYFDPRLSLTGTVSCNSCHNLMEGGDDGRPTSMGIHGRLGPRNAPTVWNSVFQASQFWDGRAASLEEQAAGPIVAQPEMGMPNHAVAVSRIKAIPGYVADFREVFDEEQPVTIENTVKAIAAFERTLISPNSPYDRFVQGDKSAMTGQQVRGLALFDSLGCTECHSGPAFNNWDPRSPSVAFEEFPRSSGGPLVTKYLLDEDLGRYEVTKNAADAHLFKVPTLRNITLTAPYFHNGVVPTLREAVRVMSVTQLDTDLSSTDLDDLVAFLSALDGEFPEIKLPRIPSRAGRSVIDDHPLDAAPQPHNEKELR